jgi:hypothetical protein
LHIDAEMQRECRLGDLSNYGKTINEAIAWLVRHTVFLAISIDAVGFFIKFDIMTTATRTGRQFSTSDSRVFKGQLRGYIHVLKTVLVRY